MWKSNVHPWVRVAGIAGASAVAMGAIGAHALTKSSETMRDIWRTASQYHLIHSLALGMAALNFAGKKRTYVCSLFLGGMILFCGSCYTVVIMNNRHPYSKPAPFGGMMLIAGWMAIAIL